MPVAVAPLSGPQALGACDHSRIDAQPWTKASESDFGILLSVILATRRFGLT